MANPPKPLYWDTDVFIHRFQRTPEHIDILEQITDAAERGELVFVQSTFSISELVKPEGEKTTPAQETLIEDFFENEFVIVRTLTEQIAFLSRKIAREYGVKPGDAVHVATAIFWKVPIMHTFDDRLLNKTKLMEDYPLKIEKPSWVGQKSFPLLTWIEGLKEAENEKARNKEIAAEITAAGVPEPPEANQTVTLSPEEGSGRAGSETREE